MDILKVRERSSLLGSVQFDLKKFVNLFGTSVGEITYRCVVISTAQAD